MTEPTSEYFRMLLDLVPLVKQMRAAQKEYFRTRAKDVLEESKSLERETDRHLMALDELAKGQQRLF